jgi:hypothetical protein
MWRRKVTTPKNDADDGSDTFRLMAYESEIRRITGVISQFENVETGGDLFGYWTHSGAPVISYALGPGLRSSRTRTAFYQDVDFLERAGRHLYQTHGLQHIGEYHSHHRLGLNEPSAGDVRTVQKGMKENNWTRFVLLIATIDGKRQLQVTQHFYLFTKGQSYLPKPLSVRVLPSVSPIRQCVDERHWPAEPIKQLSPPPNWKITNELRCQEPLYTHKNTPVEERFEKTWFSTPSGQEQLKAVVRKLNTIGQTCKMFFDEAEGIVHIELGSDIVIRLPDGFPQNAPQIVLSGVVVPTTVKWSRAMPLDHWLEDALQAVQTEGAETQKIEVSEFSGPVTRRSVDRD